MSGVNRTTENRQEWYNCQGAGHQTGPGDIPFRKPFRGKGLWLCIHRALACIDAGADRIGLLVGVHGGKFPCAITEEKAKEIFDAIKGKAVRILISVGETACRRDGG